MPETADILHKVSPGWTTYMMRPSGPGVGVGKEVSWADGAAEVGTERFKVARAAVRRMVIPIRVNFFMSELLMTGR
jgi:hypothetical protein